MHDVLIIGAGITGASLAYRLSRYQADVLVLEKENDVSLGCSRANTAIVHGGYDPAPDTLMGKFNVEGAYMCMELCDKLDVEFKKCGSFVVAFSEPERKTLEKLYQRGLENGCKGLEILSGVELRHREPQLSEEIVAALWIPDSGVINPWEFALAMMQVAVREGVALRLGEEVTDIRPREGEGYTVVTPKGTYEARYVVNATGVHSAEVHNMVAEPAFEITPTRGEYYLLDRELGDLVKSVIFQCPTEKGKGVLVSPTVHGNILVGPNAEVIQDLEDTSVTRKNLDTIFDLAKRSVPSLDVRMNIRNYAGIRPNSPYGDFFVKISAPHFLDLSAIKSPGLTCAPRTAQYAIELLEGDGLGLHEKDAWNGTRKVTRFKEIPREERESFIEKHPLYGRVICRCETITEGEIVDAIHMPITPVSLDGIKRRCGTGMGRCQGGFCGPKVLEILCRETGIRPEEVMQDKAGSYLFTGKTKEEDPS